MILNDVFVLCYALLLLIEGSVFGVFACIPSSPWLLGFSHGHILFKEII